jgi:hypothetical protein
MLANRFGRKYDCGSNGGVIVSRIGTFILFFFSIRITVHVLCAVICCLTLSTAEAVETSENLLARFKAETSQAWKLNETADESPGIIKIATKILNYSDGELTQTEEKSALLWRKDGFYLFEPAQSRGGGRKIFGKNLHYSYSILKEDEKDGYTLDKLRLERQKGFGEIPLDLFPYIKPNSYGFIPSLGQLSKVISSPRFKTVRAEEIETRFVRVHFNTVLIIPHKEVNVTGWMDFEPNNAWALQRCEYEVSPGTTSKVVKTFSLSQRAGYRPCESWEVVQGSAKGEKWERREKAQFEIVDPSTPMDEIFTLSHYGLPEPMGVPPPERPRTWIWLIAATIAAAAFAIFFAWLKQRRVMMPRGKTPEPPNRSLS